MALTNSRHVFGSLTVALLALLACSTSTALAQAIKSDSVVKATAKADKPDADGKQKVTITLDIKKSWHLYANPVDNEDFTDAQTVVTITAKVKPEAVKIDYPAGKLQDDRGIKYKVFEGKVTINALVNRAKGDTSPLEVSIKLQSCDSKRCLLPATVKIAVP